MVRCPRLTKENFACECLARAGVFCLLWDRRDEMAAPMKFRALAVALAITLTSGIDVDVAQASGVDVSGAEPCDASDVIRVPDPCVGHRCDPVTGVPCPVRAPFAAPCTNLAAASISEHQVLTVCPRSRPCAIRSAAACAALLPTPVCACCLPPRW